MDSSAPYRLLVIGDIESAEMRPAASAVRSLELCGRAATRRLGVDDSRSAAGGAAALDTLASDGWFPEIVVVCQAWPDEYSPETATRLLAEWPLARFVCAYGRWCESDGRTRSIWPGGVRVSVDRAAARLLREIDVLDGKCAPLPLTASRDEAFEFDFGATVVTAVEPGRSAAISTVDGEYRAFLSELLRSHGVEVVATDDGHGNPVIFCDWEPWLTARGDELRRLRAKHPEAKIVALASWGGPEIESAARELGADCVVPKLTPAASMCVPI